MSEHTEHENQTLRDLIKNVKPVFGCNRCYRIFEHENELKFHQESQCCISVSERSENKMQDTQFQALMTDSSKMDQDVSCEQQKYGSVISGTSSDLFGLDLENSSCKKPLQRKSSQIERQELRIEDESTRTVTVRESIIDVLEGTEKESLSLKKGHHFRMSADEKQKGKGKLSFSEADDGATGVTSVYKCKWFPKASSRRASRASNSSVNKRAPSIQVLPIKPNFVYDKRTMGGSSVQEPVLGQSQANGKITCATTQALTLEPSTVSKDGTHATFHCFVCRKAMTSNTNFFEHAFSHVSDTPFVCTLCGDKMSSNALDHLKKHESVKPFICPMCCEIFPGYLKNSHLRLHEGEPHILCDFCLQWQHGILALWSHKTVHFLKGEGFHFCNHCNKLFLLPESLKKHQREHCCNVSGNEISTEVNEVCQNDLGNDGALEKVEACSSDSKVGPSRVSKSSVRRATPIQRPYFKQSPAVVDKTRRASPVQDPVAEQSQVNEITSATPSLATTSEPSIVNKGRTHAVYQNDHGYIETVKAISSGSNNPQEANTHCVCDVAGQHEGTSGEISPTIEVCQNELGNDGALEKVDDSSSDLSIGPSRVLESSDGAFYCFVCGQLMTSSASLYHHSLSHVSDKPFSCTLCGEKMSSNAMDHLKKHQLAEPFLCGNCCLILPRKTKKLHMEGHSGEAPLECDFCHQSHIGILELWSHKTVHFINGEGFHVCNHCNKLFLLPESLRKHKEEHCSNMTCNEISTEVQEVYQNEHGNDCVLEKVEACSSDSMVEPSRVSKSSVRRATPIQRPYFKQSPAVVDKTRRGSPVQDPVAEQSQVNDEISSATPSEATASEPSIVNKGRNHAVYQNDHGYIERVKAFSSGSNNPQGANTYCVCDVAGQHEGTSGEISPTSGDSSSELKPQFNLLLTPAYKPCDKCISGFKTMQSMQIHIIKHHS